MSARAGDQHRSVTQSKRPVKSTHTVFTQLRAATAAWDARQAQIVGVVGQATKVYDPSAMPDLDRALWAAVVDLLAAPGDVTARPW